MDITKQLEKLDNAEKTLRDVKTREVLSRAGNALACTGKTCEVFNIECKNVEELTSFKIGDILKITGRMLGIGKHKTKYYTEEDLKWAVEYLQGKHIPVKVDHKDKEVGATVGKVDRFYWDDIEKVIMYDAHINDLTQARNIIDQVVREVSATIASADVFDPQFGIRGTQPEIKELSLVESGAFQGNSITVV